MSAVELLSETEWQPFLRLLPCRSEPTSLRSKLDCLLWTYLNILEAEANSPSAREVATVLETIARFAHAFAGYLYAHHLHSQGEWAFNTANEAAGDILAKIEIKPENWSVLGAASRANENFLLPPPHGRPGSFVKGQRRGSRSKASPRPGYCASWPIFCVRADCRFHCRESGTSLFVF